MDKVFCLILAGGRGSRFGSPLKFLTSVCGKPIIEKLVEDIETICQYIVLALSKRTLAAAYLCRDMHSIECVETSGEDLVNDLTLLLDVFPKPLLVLGADIHLSSNQILLDFITRALKAKEDVITLVVGESEKLVGVALFKKSYGSWINIPYPGDSVIDIDSYDDLKRVEYRCSQP